MLEQGCGLEMNAFGARVNFVAILSAGLRTCSAMWFIGV